MLPTLLSVDLARWQFAFTASFHFLFVPLTLGLTWVLFTMETMYVRTGKQVYKDMTRFWGKLLGINFAIGVFTGLTMAFEFGTSWAFFSQSVGDVFGTPLAIEGLFAFMLESTFFGVFFFGWDKLSKKQHLFATFCLAIGSSSSALLILIANGFMQDPAGGIFDPALNAMVTTSLYDVLFNSAAQIGFAHTVIAGYTTAAVFVVGISAYYLLKKQDVDFAKRSIAVGLGFGLVASVMVAMIGDSNGDLIKEKQPLKMAAVEGEFETPSIPAAWTMIAFPNQSTMEQNSLIKIPYGLSIIADNSLDGTIPGIKTLIDVYSKHAIHGSLAYRESLLLRQDIAKNINLDVKSNNHYIAFQKENEMCRSFEYTPPGSEKSITVSPEDNCIGYGLMLSRDVTLLKAFGDEYKNVNVFEQFLVNHSPAEITSFLNENNIPHTVLTAYVPNVSSVFWGFRIMVGLGVLMILVLSIGLYFSVKNTLTEKRWLLNTMVYMIPAPFIAAVAGWFITEHGRQPWVINSILPTNISASSLNAFDVGLSLVIFVVFDLTLLAVELFLMFKFARLGPSALHEGNYHFEKLNEKGDK